MIGLVLALQDVGGQLDNTNAKMDITLNYLDVLKIK